MHRSVKEAWMPMNSSVTRSLSSIQECFTKLGLLQQPSEICGDYQWKFKPGWHRLSRRSQRFLGPQDYASSGERNGPGALWLDPIESSTLSMTTERWRSF